MKTSLYNKLLPIIINNEKIIIYSPFSRKIVELSEQQFNDPELHTYLSNLDFF
jgi:hypothetical protein